VKAQGCIQNPCFNGGSCNEAGGGQFTCTCVTGYVGIVCEANLAPAVTVATTVHPICSPNPCDNGGVCSNDNNIFKCTCQPGWLGTFCHQAALTAAPTGPTTTVNTLCDHNPCTNGGTCSSSGSGFGSAFSCACAPGYSGLFCQSGDVTSAPTTAGTTAVPRICTPNPCDNGGTCTAPTAGSFACLCVPGFMGTFCHQVNPNAGVAVTIATTTIPRLCNPNPCNNGGLCSSNDTSSFECTCVNGYTGTFCHTVPEICSPNPCANGGQCGSSTPGSFDCTCAAGYSGFFCQAGNAPTQSSIAVPSSCSNGVTKSTLGCKPADVVFLVGFGKEDSMDHQGDFIKFLVDSWSMGPQGMQVGVVAYAASAMGAINITDYTDDKSGLLTAIGSLTSALRPSGDSNLEAALNYARINSFTNARPGVPQVVIPIINQTPTDTTAQASLVTAADRLKATCAVIIGEYVIGTPPNADLVETVVSQPYVDYYNYFSSYTALESSGLRFDANACP